MKCWGPFIIFLPLILIQSSEVTFKLSKLPTEHAEPDTFFCFTNLMSEIRDNFCKTLDTDALGITGLIRKTNNLLRLKDPELWQDFVTSMITRVNRQEDKSLN